MKHLTGDKRNRHKYSVIKGSSKTLYRTSIFHTYNKDNFYWKNPPLLQANILHIVNITLNIEISTMTHRKTDTFTFSKQANFSLARGELETQEPHFWVSTHCLPVTQQQLCTALISLCKCSTTWTGWPSGQSEETQVETACVCSTLHFQATCHPDINNAMAILLWNKFFVNMDFQNWNA